MNRALRIYQNSPEYGKPRNITAIKTGFKIQKKGQDIREFEYDSKSYNNLYYAIIHRHNSNTLRPDPLVL